MGEEEKSSSRKCRWYEASKLRMSSIVRGLSSVE